MPEVQTQPEKTTTPPAEPTRKRRWLPESRLLRWVVYVGLAIIGFNAVVFLVLLYFGTRPNLPYVDYFPEYRQLSVDAHARHGIAPAQPGQPDSWVILEGMRVRAEKIIESWKASEEDRRAAAEPRDSRVSICTRCATAFCVGRPRPEITPTHPPCATSSTD